MRFSIVKLSKGQSAVEKASLPNDWSYELAEEVVRKFVQRKFVDKSMVSNLSTGQMTDSKLSIRQFAGLSVKRKKFNENAIEI